MFENYKVPKELIPSDPRFGVGPSLIPMSFVESLAKTGTSLLGTSHRKSAVKNLVKEVQDNFNKYFDIPAGYEVVLGNGGATFLFDMIGLGLVNKRSAHFTCGEFSNKWYKSHAKIPWIEAVEFKKEVGEGVDAQIDSSFDTICYTLNETSTGVMAAEFPKNTTDALVCVDATSGAGQIFCPLENVDVFFFSPQKVFASEGGTFVAIMSPKAIKRAMDIEASDRYIPEIMNWKLAIDNSKLNQTYNTPCVTSFWYLNEQLKLMNEVTYKGVLDLAKKKADLVYGWAESKDYLKPYVTNPKYRSTCVATINLDDKFDAEEITKVLRAQGAVLDIDSYRKLGKNQFRISLFHNVTYENLEKLTKIISQMVETHN